MKEKGRGGAKGTSFPKTEKRSERLVTTGDAYGLGYFNGKAHGGKKRPSLRRRDRKKKLGGSGDVRN